MSQVSKCQASLDALENSVPSSPDLAQSGSAFPEPLCVQRVGSGAGSGVGDGE